MPTHDWLRVAADVFHDFHHAWLCEISKLLNRGVLPRDYYALIEEHAHRFDSDHFKLQLSDRESGTRYEPQCWPGFESRVTLVPASVKLTAESEIAFYRRK
jgi:hypothetical protein